MDLLGDNRISRLELMCKGRAHFIGEDGHLTVSPIVGWQDYRCANSYINLLTGESADDEDI